MDEKTAEIPSLKEFNEQQKERAAHDERSRSMQTKKQMQRSSEKSSAPLKKKKSSAPATRGGSAQKKAPSGKANLGDTQVFGAPEEKSNKPIKSPGERKKSPPRHTPPEQSRVRRSTETVRRSSSARSSGTSETKRRKPAPAPETYARERMAQQERGNRTHSPADNTRPARPRIPAQKSEAPVKKSKKPISPAARKFRTFVAYFAIVFVVLVVGVILSLTVLFKTEAINVSGNGDYTAQEIIEVSGLHMGENIFTAPKGRASSKIEKAYPYVEEADVYCVFPNAINIDLTMAKPACVVESLGGYYVVSDKGKVLEVASTTDEIEAPVIEGLTVEGKSPGEYVQFGSDVVGSALEEMFTAFREYGCTKITAINVAADDDGAIEIKYVYDDRIVVYLGLPEHINYKIQTAQTIITEKIDVNNATLAGDLDVSMCYESKKSYFNQYTILAPNVAPTIVTTAPTDATGATEAMVYYNENEGEDDSEEEVETTTIPTEQQESPTTEPLA